RRDLHAFGNRILKRDVETALRFRQPTEPTVREGRVPFVPLPAHLVAELRAPGQFKRHVFPLAAQADVEWRAGFDQFGDFAEIFQLAIGAGDGRATVLADDDD